MRWPNSFRMENLEEKTKQLVDGPKLNESVIRDLLDAREGYIQSVLSFDNPIEIYNHAWRCTEKYKFSICDLEHFVSILEPKTIDFGDKYVGYMVSAMVNQIINDSDKIVLRPRMKMNRLGCFFERGKMVIEGDTNNFTGYMMWGVKLTGNGNAGNYTCLRMQGGRVVIKGDVKGELGTQMLKGDIYVHGGIKRLYNDCKAANIYNFGEKIWPKDEDS